jgi:hypothetical protein
MQKSQEEFVVLEEGHEAGIVNSCCTASANAKIK